VVTVHRRYHELDACLRRIAALASLFPERPRVRVVWADPEPARLHAFRQWRQEGLLDEVLHRHRLPEEGQVGGTSYPESHNLRRGLIRTFEEDPECIAIACAADVLPSERCLRWLIGQIESGEARAVVFHWHNAIAVGGCYSTNFFAVPGDPAYWPPLSRPDDPDVLERQFALAVRAAHAPGVVEMANHAGCMFAHAHRSESLPAWPSRPESEVVEAPLCLTGRLPWYRRLWRFLTGRV
jgi:hypothetical protein